MDLVELTVDHMPDLLALTRSAGWNQNEKDWRMMLAAGRGWGFLERSDATADGTLVASAVIQPYPPDRAWISMVLVLPAFRRQGLASRLMRVAIETIESQSLMAWLDATDDGRQVYQQLAFTDVFRFTRWQCPDRPSASRICDSEEALTQVWPMQGSHQRAVVALDRAAFGAPRAALITHLAERAASLAWVAGTEQVLTAMVLGRDGTHAWQIGPLVADSEARAARLMSQALDHITGPVFCDLPDCHTGLAARLRAAGFSPQRSFTRMRRDQTHLPAPPAIVESDRGPQAYLLAGPELG